MLINFDKYELDKDVSREKLLDYGFVETIGVNPNRFCYLTILKKGVVLAIEILEINGELVFDQYYGAPVFKSNLRSLYGPFYEDKKQKGYDYTLRKYNSKLNDLAKAHILAKRPKKK
ncbi:MAG: hypothetical protein IKE10_02525 [Bacilli bacterium]|nr:hypothetical protein [Bacilli bacterium]